MHWLAEAMLISAAIPLAVAWRAGHGWTIRHALAWGWLAWLAWLGFAWHPCTETNYAALTFTGAAGIAVFGARRPGVVAWNFIVGSLLIVLWLGWAEGLLDGSGLKLGNVRLFFVTATLAASILSFVPTSLGIGALGIGLSCSMLLIALWRGRNDVPFIATFNVAASIWIAMLTRRDLLPKNDPSQFNQLWRSYRDKYGAVWTERLREQFNNAARNNCWPVHLYWTGLQKDKADAIGSAESDWTHYSTLMALTKRFRSDQES